MHPRVCCCDLTYPKVACFGGMVVMDVGNLLVN